MAELDQSLVEFLRSLFTDTSTAHAFVTNPVGTLEDHHVADATPDQLNRAVSTLISTPGAISPACQVRLEAAANAPGGVFSAVGYQGAVPTVLAEAPPLLAGYAQTAATLAAATTITNVTNVDDSQHTTINDSSIHQGFTNIGGTQTIDQQNATGAGAVAAGPDSHVTAATGGGMAIGENANVDHTSMIGGSVTDSTINAGDVNAPESGHDHIFGSGNVTDANAAGANVGGTEVGSSTHVASQGSNLGEAGSSVNTADAPGAAAASGGAEAAGGGTDGGGGGTAEGGGNTLTLQEGGTNVNATGSEGVNTAGAGDANQINQHAIAFAAGDQSGAPTDASPVGGEATQVASIAPEGGAPAYFDQAPDPGAGTEYAGADTGMAQPTDPGVSDQPAGTEHTDPLG